MWTKSALAVAVPVLTVSMLALPTEAAPTVQIVYVQYDSPGTDRGSNRSLNAEWVRIRNVSDESRSLKGWTLRDTSRHVYRFGEFQLGAGKAVMIHTGKGRNSPGHRFWGREWYVWNNTGDRAILRNRAGSVVDTCRWTDDDGDIAC